MKHTLSLLLTISLGVQILHAEAFPTFGVDSVSSEFFREWYQNGDLRHYLDNGSDYVTYEAETTGEWGLPEQMVFSINEESPVNIKQKQAFHGLYRSLVNNMVVGVSQGFQKTLELVGVGYRVSNQGNLIEFSLGYTHPIFLMLPPEVKVETKSERNQNPVINLESCDKQLLGLICAKIRSFRKPEPYKGKGILFKGEVIRRKSGKSASAK